MSQKKNILAICGSTRAKSANKDIINTINKLGQDHLNITSFDISTLPYFNQDITDEYVSQSVTNFRQSILKADGVLICTPEYVFSLPGILKNAIEWTVSTTVFIDKPTVLITASSSGEKAHQALLLIMNTVGIKTNEDMCILISGVKSKLNEKGQVIDEMLINKLQQMILNFQEIAN